jgi:non-heme chloroperoxidase
VIPPFLLKTEDNPEGVDGRVFADIKAAIVNDRYAYFRDFLDNFYNVDVLGPDRISEQAWQASFNVAAGSSPYATYACVDTWLTDFRADVAKIDVPTLVVHGTEDRILPFEATAARLGELIADVTIVPVEGGPHNIGWTHPEEVNEALLGFLAGTTAALQSAV